MSNSLEVIQFRYVYMPWLIGRGFLFYRKYLAALKCESCVAYRVKIPTGQDAHTLFFSRNVLFFYEIRAFGRMCAQHAFSKFLKSRQRKSCVIDTISENLSYSENFTEQKSTGNGAKAERHR